MADQIFNVSCGFFNAVNNDRTYSAEQMNMPYKRIVSNGVFASPAGTPSTDFQVSSANDGMKIIVSSGEGIFANKWFKSDQGLTIDVPSNTSLYSRIDSVIIQVDTRPEGRVGNIVYRTGTPATTPEAPEINTTSNVTEYRVANITVDAYAATIGNDVITDLRGSESCPWITSLVQQPDTSTLWQQFQTAYQNQYDAYSAEYQQYTAEQRQAWEDFLSTLTSELSVATNVITFTSTYTAVDTVTNIPINIASFDADTDVLLVFINGLLAVGKYSLNSNKTSIDLNTYLEAGNSVYFVVLHSVIAADIQSTISMIQTLDNKLSNYMSDSGWLELTLESGVSAYSNLLTPEIRSNGNKIYLRGAVKGLTAFGSPISAIPVEYKPDMEHTFTTVAVADYNTNAPAIESTVLLTVGTDGYIRLKASTGTISATSAISLDTTFLKTDNN